MFTKRVAYVFFGIMAIGSATIAAGYQGKSVAPPLQPPHGGAHARIVQGVIAPSQAMINATLATMTPIGPGVLYVETYPTDQQNAMFNQGHSETELNHSAALLKPSGRPRNRAHFGQPDVVLSESPNVTGINHWWTYEEDAIPGIGKYMANVATGNLLVQADDMAIAHKGIELAFRRTYNSFSHHDYANTDGSTPDNYGDGWTNTFDAHIAFNDLDTGQGVSVFDIDGARYDYSAVCNPGCVYTPPAGQFATLSVDAAGDYKWIKKTGTVYWFHNPIAANAGLDGRLEEIVGRNSNTFIKFAYYFDANHNDSQHLNEIRVVPEWAGPPATATSYVDLKFANFTVGSGTNRLLSKLFWIDMTTFVEYNYTTSSELAEVYEPSNTSNASASIPQWYTYYSASGHLVQSAVGGRWASTNGTDGGFDDFNYTILAGGTNANVTSIQYFGWINPTVNDGFSTGQLQPAFAYNYGVSSPYRTVTFVNSAATPLPGSPPPAPAPTPTGSAACGTTTSTSWYDTDGHESLYCFDSTSRVVQADHWTGSLWLKMTQGWDGSNNLVSTTDARNNETDYAYDSNGNTLVVGEPSVTINGQNVRPTSRYTYDAYNNVLAYCDPNFDNAHGGNWGQTYSCPTSYSSSQTNGGPELFTWAAPTDGSETFGQLTDSYTTTGYHRHFNYDPTAQNGTDYGLPTSVAGDAIVQDDNNSYSPTQSFKYDEYGNLICYNKGNGWWALTYDSDDRQTAVGDPDDASLVVSACGKTPGLAGSNIVTAHTYFADSAVNTLQSPSEHAQGVSTSYTYDADGDTLTETHHYSYTSSSPAPVVPTQKWYDATDRLVEVEEPYDTRKYNDISQTPMEYFSYPWLTRYLYDLSQNTAVSISGSPLFDAHGDLFDTQVLLDGVLQSDGVATGNPKTWTDTKGEAYDSLDRPVDQFAYTTGSVLNTTTLAYDTTPTTIGFLQSQCNAVNQCDTLNYDSRGNKVSDNFSDSTPSLSFTYDADGRTLTAVSSVYGTESYSYNPDGALTEKVEPSGGGVTSPATINYDYYADDTRKDLSVSSSAFTQADLFTYSYRADRDIEKQTTTYAVGQQPGTYNLSWVYTSAGREDSRSDVGPYNLNASITDSYNSSGQLSTRSLPSGSFSSYKYDAENEPLTFTDKIGSEAIYYNIRGEALATNPLEGYDESEEQSANGALFNYVPSYYFGGPIYDPSESSFNAQMGAQLSQLMATTDPPSHGATPTPIPQWACDNSQNPDKVTTWTYDTAGRQTGGTGGFYEMVRKSDTTCGNGTVAKTYDALNRLSSQVTQGWGLEIGSCSGATSASNFEMLYNWGPNGHVIMIGSATAASGGSPPPFGTVTYETIHWDGDVPLFTTNSAGQLDDIKVNTIGDVTPLDPTFTGLTLWDRDSSGSVVSDHNSSGYDSTTQPNPFHKTYCTGAYNGSANFTGPSTMAGNPGMFVGQGTLLSEPGSDGIYDGANIIQGVRTYDSTANTWTTPDAYAGDINDPLSQRSYMWNRNNPVSYSDPSGYCLEDLCIGEGIVAGAVILAESPEGQEVGQEAEEAAAPVAQAAEQEAGAVGQQIGREVTSQTGRVTSAIRQAVNNLGAKYGCSNCGTMNPGTKSGNWVTNHVLPTAMKAMLQRVGIAVDKIATTFNAHCTFCSAQQGGNVSNLVQKIPLQVTPH